MALVSSGVALKKRTAVEMFEPFLSQTVHTRLSRFPREATRIATDALHPRPEGGITPETADGPE